MFQVRMFTSSSILLCIFLQTYIVLGQYRRVCYYTNWAQYRPKEGKYYPEDIDPSLCTHIIFAFAKLNGNRLVAYEWNDESTDWMRGMYDRCNDVKAKNPEIKTLLAVGGWNMASAPFTAMVATAASRSEFATSTVQFLRKRNFDGIDLDWEYPANRGSPPEDKHRYTMLVQEVRRVFDEEARRTRRPALLLTSAVAAGKSNIDSAYDVAQVCRDMDFINVMTYDLHGSWENITGHNSPLFPHSVEMDMDFINVMTYDLHGSWENITGHNSPLFPHSVETGKRRYLNMDWAANYWVNMGCPKHKLVIGMGLYGRSFTLKDQFQNGNMAPAKGKGKPGKYTREGGFLSYYEICDIMARGGQSYYIKDQEVPYVVLGDQWVGYDDADSLRIKVQWVKKNGFSGVMVWSLDLDDFKGTCGQGPYPLLTAINQELMGTNMAPPRPRPRRPPPRPRQQRPQPKQPWENQNNVNQWNNQNNINNNNNNANTWGGAMNPQSNSLLPKATPKPITTTAPNMPHLSNEFDCPPTVNDYFPNPNSCHEYFICADGLSFKFKCAHPLRWNTATNFCDWPDNVVCTQAPKPVKPKPKPITPKPAPPRRRTTVNRFVTPRPPTRQNVITQQRRTPTPPRTQQIFPQNPPTWRQQNNQPPPPPRIFTPRQAPPVRVLFTTPAPVRTTQPPQNYPTPPWNDWYRFLSEFWRVMASLGANPPGQPGTNLPGTIPGLPNPGTQQPQPFCANKLDGIHPDPTDCSKYIDCVQGRAYKGSCPANTAFEPKFGVCDYKHNVAACAP